MRLFPKHKKYRVFSGGALLGEYDTDAECEALVKGSGNLAYRYEIRVRHHWERRGHGWYAGASGNEIATTGLMLGSRHLTDEPL